MVGRRVKLALGEAIKLTRKTYVPGEPKDCGHTTCQLSDWEKCCACNDERKNAKGADLFFRYVDGVGWRRTAHRAEYYCPTCRSQLDPCLDFEHPYKVCGHNYCELSTPSGCCGCLDRRERDTSHPHYIPLHGYLPNGNRNAHYCLNCQSLYDHLLRARTPDSPISEGDGVDDVPLYDDIAPYHLAPPHASHRFTHSSETFPRVPTRKPYRREIAAHLLDLYDVTAAATTPQKKSCASADDDDADHHTCALESTAKCCACADTRPLAPRYPEYVDGLGERLTAYRWTRYCFWCRARCARSAAAATSFYYQSQAIRHQSNDAAKVRDITFENTPHPRTIEASSSTAPANTSLAIHPALSLSAPSPPPSLSRSATATDVEDFEDDALSTMSSRRARSTVDTDDEWARFSEAGTSDWNGLTDIDDDDDDEELDVQADRLAVIRHPRSNSSVSESAMSSMSDWNSVSASTLSLEEGDDWSVVSDVD